MPIERGYSETPVSLFTKYCDARRAATRIIVRREAQRRQQYHGYLTADKRQQLINWR